MWLFYTFAGCAFLVYFSAHPVHLIYSLIGLFICFVVWVVKQFTKNKRFIMISSNPDKKEFDKITLHLKNKHYVGLLDYFYSTETSIKNANKFLKTPKGIAFLSMYAKTDETKSTDVVSISKLILEVEREENIISCAVDVLKAYS